MVKMDKMQMISGIPFEINQHIIVHHPTLGEIVRYGEENYWQLVCMLTSTSFDLRFQLDDLGLDYEDVDDFATFCMITPGMKPTETSILLGDLDLSQLKVCSDDNGDILLANEDHSIIIDRLIYQLFVDYLRKLHGLKRNYKVAGNKRARKFYMEEERKNLEEKLKKESSNENKSELEPLVGALVNNSNFKYDYETVMRLPIYTFMDAAKRVTKFINYTNLMTGIYTGNIDSKKIPKKQMDFMGDI